jgi:hypothetical protein
VRALPDAVAAQIAKIKSAIESGGCSYTAGSGASVYGGVSDASYSGYGDAAEYVSVVDPAFERRLVEALQKNFNYIKRYPCPLNAVLGSEASPDSCALVVYCCVLPNSCASCPLFFPLCALRSVDPTPFASFPT